MNEPAGPFEGSPGGDERVHRVGLSVLHRPRSDNDLSHCVPRNVERYISNQAPGRRPGAVMTDLLHVDHTPLDLFGDRPTPCSPATLRTH